MSRQERRADFDALYDGAALRLLRTLTALAGSRQEAEDAAAEAWTRTLVRWSRVRTLDDPEAWVRRVGVNLVLDQHRRRARERRVRHLIGGAPSSPGPEASDVPDVVVALRRLPLAQRTALVLHHLADRSVAQIAADLDVPEGTVKARLSRGRAALAAALQPEEVGPRAR